MTLSVIWLSFCFANDNRMTPPSGSHFAKNYKPDDTLSDLHYFSKCEPDGFAKGQPDGTSIRFTIFFKM